MSESGSESYDSDYSSYTSSSINSSASESDFDSDVDDFDSITVSSSSTVSSGGERLLDYCDRGNIAGVEESLNRGVSVNYKDRVEALFE
jgi:hypothetical protein